MTQTEQEIKKLNTLNDNYTALVDIFDHLVPREYVVLTLSAPSDVDWTMYSVVVTNNDKGTSDIYAIPSNGVLEFEVKYDTNYTIKLPVLGDFITPKDLTYTAGMKMREVGCSYRVVGVFGIDANGKCYSIEQIEALEDKSIIKYGGYTDFELENYINDDGSYGAGFVWIIGNEIESGAWSGSAIEFSQELLPFVQDESTALLYCDGEAYTRYIISEGVRLGVNTPSSTACASSTISIKGKNASGFVPSSGQYRKFYGNRTLISSMYSILGASPISSYDGYPVSVQYDESKCVFYGKNAAFSNYSKTTKRSVFKFFSINKIL